MTTINYFIGISLFLIGLFVVSDLCGTINKESIHIRRSDCRCNVEVGRYLQSCSVVRIPLLLGCQSHGTRCGQTGYCFATRVANDFDSSILHYEVS